MPVPDADALRTIAIEIATEAAAFVAEARAAATEEMLAAGTVTKSTPTDMVTAVDKASELHIVTALHELRPDDAILGEEGAGVPGTSGLQWVIDPIDGTTNFVYGYPASAVSVGVVDATTRESIAGAVADIARAEVFSAARGGGAFLNNTRLTLSDGPATIGHCLVSTGFNYSAAERVKQAAVVARLLPIVRDLRRSGSCALDLCWTAAGRSDAYFERGTAWWDYAAGLLVAHEVGLQGSFENDGMLWVAHPRIVEEFLPLIRD